MVGKAGRERKGCKRRDYIRGVGMGCWNGFREEKLNNSMTANVELDAEQWSESEADSSRLSAIPPRCNISLHYPSCTNVSIRSIKANMPTM